MDMVVSRRSYSHPLAFTFFFNFIYLFMRDTQREAETQAEGEAVSMQSLMWDLIPRLWDHTLSQRQMPNR